jgi:acyl-coenzyme A thioesterase 13
MATIPAGYVPLARSSPFLDSVGPLYEAEAEAGLRLGLWIEKRHCNQSGYAHGGLLMTLADLVLGKNVARVSGASRALTVSLSFDFVGLVEQGVWLSAEADVQRTGKQLGFANAYLFAKEKRVARASAVFAITLPDTRER